MEIRCPLCGSNNCEERDNCYTCVDCGVSFRIYDMQDAFERIMKSQKKTLDYLADK